MRVRPAARVARSLAGAAILVAWATCVAATPPADFESALLAAPVPFVYLALAFGRGFLIAGLLAGGALVGYIAYRTGCNGTLNFRSVHGPLGGYVPVLMGARLTIGWQGIVVGASAQVWSQAPARRSATRSRSSRGSCTPARRRSA